MPFHASILFLDVPDPGLEGGVVIFDVVDDALEMIVLVPDDVLCGHVAVEVDIGVENVVVGVDLLPQQLLVFHSPVQLSLLGLELFVVLPQNHQRTVINCFHLL